MDIWVLASLEEKLLSQNSFQAILNLKYPIIENYTATLSDDVKVIIFQTLKVLLFQKI